MKKKIAILGSTGSIGENTLKIIDKDKKNFNVELLSTNNNILKIYKQAKKFQVKNLIIHNKQSFLNNRTFFKNKKIRIFQNVNEYLKNKKEKIRLYNVVNQWIRWLDTNNRNY